MYLKIYSKNEKELKEQMKGDAEKRVKTNLTLEAIVNNENIEVTEEDIDAELEKMASMYGTEVEQLKQMLGGNADAIKEDLKLDRKSTRLNSSHVAISYAVFCLKKKKKQRNK